MDITLNNVRFSYVNVFEPRSMPGQDAPKYSVTILLPKGNAAAVKAIQDAIQKAEADGLARKWGGVKPPVLPTFFHDGDRPRPSDGMPYGEECRGCYVFTASSKNRPFVVDKSVQNIIDPTQVYSGQWGNVSISVYPYSFSGKKGIGCGLNGLQVVRDDEPLSGKPTASSVFSAVSVDPITGAPI